MNKKNLYTYITASLAILVPVPGRFGYGIILLLGLNIFLFLGILFKRIVSQLKMQEFMPVLIAVFLVSLAILYKQILILYSPVNALILGFSIFMTAISSYLTGYLYEENNLTLKEELHINIKKSGYFSLYAILIFLFRDITGYGTISFPVYDGLKEIVIYTTNNDFSFSAFWASIPGAMLLCAMLVVVFAKIGHIFDIIRESEKSGKKSKKTQTSAKENKAQEISVEKENSAKEEQPAKEETPVNEEQPVQQENKSVEENSAEGEKK